MRLLTTGLLFAGAMALGSCGGGGGGGSATTGSQDQRPPMSMVEAATVSLKQEESGPTAERVLDYLQVHASGGPWPNSFGEPLQHPPGLARFESPPTLRIAEGTSSHQRALIHRVVALVNRELPYDLHVQTGEDAPPLTAIEDVPDGQIFVDIAPESDWNHPVYHRLNPEGGITAVAQLDSVDEYDREQERWELKERRAAHIWVNADFRRPDEFWVHVGVHELLHVLGFAGHVDADQFSDSIISYDRTLKSKRVPEIDGAALRALYMRLKNGTEPEDLSLDSLGPWSHTTTMLAGEQGEVTFGVNHRNEVSVPWTDGTEPPRSLAQSGLRGTVAWEGDLLGFTPALEAVAGDAEIRVDLATLTGNADFTELEEWPAGETPTDGTGTQWYTGSLGYTITVSGNYIRNTGGDDGMLSGTFYGDRHEGVAGSVERQDLTAAFGARKQ